MRQRSVTQCIIQGKFDLNYYIYVGVGILDYSSDDAAMYVPPFTIDELFTIKAEPSQRVVRCRDYMFRNHRVVEKQLHQPGNNIFMLGI